ADSAEYLEGLSARLRHLFCQGPREYVVVHCNITGSRRELNQDPSALRLWLQTMLPGDRTERNVATSIDYHKIDLAVRLREGVNDLTELYTEHRQLQL